MIGLFGVFQRDRAEPVDLGGFAARHRAGYNITAEPSRGAAIGRAAHAIDRGRGVIRCGGLSVVALGDIYNAEEFVGRSGSFDPAPVIAELYRADRLDRLSEANGHFCAAIYDANAHRLTLVTDRLALFPLHVWESGGQAVFASLIYVMLADPRIPRKADSIGLAQLFTMQRTIGEYTSVAGVRALPAACIWQIDATGVRQRQYWQLAWREPSFEARECGQLLAQALRRAVSRATNHGGRVGLLLSGGIDSRWILGAAPPQSMSCWTTASFAENPELDVARRTAELCGAEHHAAVVSPEDTLDCHDDAVIEDNGLYPASPQFSAFMPKVGKACDTVLSGHGLDYTLRGYYLPARFLEYPGGRIRLPVLRSIPRRPTGADVLDNLRQGPPTQTLERIIDASWRERWWSAQGHAMQRVLSPWLEAGDPYNAWDAFILHAVSKHYAFTGMMSVRPAANLRMPAFDNEVMDIYLQMKPAWRCSSRPVLQALRLTSPELANLASANTSFRADLGPWLDVAGALSRGVLRRLGLARRPAVPSKLHSAGSWQNVTALFREGPRYRQRLTEIKQRLDALVFGVMDAGKLRTVIDEHLDGRAEHTKLLRQLLTHDAWVRHFGISGHA